MNFRERNFLVAGGSSGIGLATVRLMRSKEAQIYNLSRTAAPEWPDGINHLSADVTGPLDDLAPFLPDKLHGLLYAVGSINLKPFSRLTDDDFIRDYRLNVVGAASVIRSSLKSLKAAEGASIVLISSVAATTGMNFHTSIAAAKAAVEGLAVALAAELSVARIRVNVIAPSLTDTPLAQQLLNTSEKKEASAKRHPLGRIGVPEDIANMAAFLLSDESTWITGQVIGVDGGMGNIK